VSFSPKPGPGAGPVTSSAASLEVARRLFAKGEWAKAAEAYLRAGADRAAAESWERAGELKRAAELYERHFADTSTAGNPGGPDRNAALRAGQLYARGGEPDRAVEVLLRGRHVLAAASLLESRQSFARAAELFARADSHDKAAECWARGGEPQKAALQRGEAALRAERPAEAAVHFLEGHDYYRAAELYESLGRVPEAAASFEAAGAFAEAAEAYLRTGDRRRAALALEKGGQFQRAAELFEALGDRAQAARLHEAAGDFFRSGQAAVQAGDPKRAVSLLQRVSPGDERYLAATELLAQMFIESGLPLLGAERLQLALGNAPPARDNLSLYYWLAVCREQEGEAQAALDLYQKVLALDFGFRDASERAQRLAAGRVPRRESRPAPPEPLERRLTPTGGALVASLPAAPVAAPAAPIVVTPLRGSRLVGRELVGRGPLGPVYRAEEEVDGRQLALRVLEVPGMADPVLRALLADVAPAARLSHPNVARVLGLAEHEGRPCLVGELVRGTNMSAFLRTGQRLSVKRAHALGRALALALSFVHGKGLAHGSVRPSNLLVSSGILKLADLGLGPLARVAVPYDAYRSPEAHLDAAGDMYALGATLYHLLTGTAAVRPPQAPPPPSKLVAGVPESFDQLLLRALAPDPEARFRSTREIVHAFDAMVTIS
jgi:tetratricopeptide (TPR) repeat protein